MSTTNINLAGAFLRRMAPTQSHEGRRAFQRAADVLDNSDALAKAERMQKVLTEIVAMAVNADSPAHSMQGRTNAWANLGERAALLAREVLGD